MSHFRSLMLTLVLPGMAVFGLLGWLSYHSGSTVTPGLLLTAAVLYGFVIDYRQRQWRRAERR